MSKISRPFTTRRTVLGLPVGRRHTDWQSVGRAAAAGAGALSVVVGGARAARRALPHEVRDAPAQVGRKAATATGRLGRTAGQVAGAAADRIGRIAPAGPAEARAGKATSRGGSGSRGGRGSDGRTSNGQARRQTAGSGRRR